MLLLPLLMCAEGFTLRLVLYYTGQIDGEAQPKRAELGGWLPTRLVALDGGKWMQTTENGEDLDSP